MSLHALRTLPRAAGMIARPSATRSFTTTSVLLQQNNYSSSNNNNNNNSSPPRRRSLLSGLFANPPTPRTINQSPPATTTTDSAEPAEPNTITPTPSLLYPQSPSSNSPDGTVSMSSILSTLRSRSGPSSANLISQSLALPPTIAEDTRLPRMGPTAGRSVLVQGDVVSAFSRLARVVQLNRVRADMNRQRFHERPGLKRKRLRKERYRRRFKEGFKRMVGVVLEMKNRGM